MYMYHRRDEHLMVYVPAINITDMHRYEIRYTEHICLKCALGLHVLVNINHDFKKGWKKVLSYKIRRSSENSNVNIFPTQLVLQGSVYLNIYFYTTFIYTLFQIEKKTYSDKIMIKLRVKVVESDKGVI